MTSAPPPPSETTSADTPATGDRHRAPALLIVLLGLVAAVVVAVVADAATAALTLAAVLAGAAVARLVGRGRRPEGIAVRSTWVDVLILLALAAGVALLALGPGIR